MDEETKESKDDTSKLYKNTENLLDMIGKIEERFSIFKIWQEKDNEVSRTLMNKATERTTCVEARLANLEGIIKDLNIDYKMLDKNGDQLKELRDGLETIEFLRKDIRNIEENIGRFMRDVHKLEDKVENLNGCGDCEDDYEDRLDSISNRLKELNSILCALSRNAVMRTDGPKNENFRPIYKVNYKANPVILGKTENEAVFWLSSLLEEGRKESDANLLTLFRQLKDAGIIDIVGNNYVWLRREEEGAK